MNTQNLALGLVVVVVSVGLSMWLGGTKVVDRVTEKTGAFPGPDVHTPLFLQGGVTETLYASTNTTATSQTLLASDLVNNDGVLFRDVDITPNTGALTYTLPASSTMSHVITNEGERATQCWHNATGTAAAVITIAAGAGVDLQVASATAPTLASNVLYPIGAGDSACMDWYRESDTDIKIDWTVHDDAD